MTDVIIKDGVKYRPVYSSGLLNIGDRGIMNMDKEARYWGRQGPADGTPGQVVGFKEYFTTIDHNSGYRKSPGIYRGNGAACVMWEGADRGDYVGSDFAIPNDVYEQRFSEGRGSAGHDIGNVKMFDLPEFDYMVGNVFETTRFGGVERCTIRSIEFDRIVNTMNGELLPYDKWRTDHIIHVDLASGGASTVSVLDIRNTVELGNYHAWLHDRSQLKFNDLADEAAFYFSLGKAVQLKSPGDIHYKWKIGDLIEAVGKGEVDLIKMSGGLFGSASFPTGYKLDDDLAEFAARCRAEIIKGFADGAYREHM